MSAGFSVDTSGLRGHNADRLARLAPPAICRERVLQAVLDALADNRPVTRLTLADDFDVSPSHFTLRRIIHELAADGLIVLVPDEAGVEDYVITLPVKRRRRAA